MSISVNFETSAGANTTRQFQPGDGVSVYGKVTGALGVGEPSANVILELVNGAGQSVGYQNLTTDIWGDYAGWLDLPFVSQKMILKISAQLPVSGVENVTVPIGVGVVADPLPVQVDQSQSLIDVIEKVAIWGGVAIVGFYVLPLVVGAVRKK
jgi:hypothetical protein